MRRQTEPERREETLYGVHPVMQALEARRRSVERVLVARESAHGNVARALKLARQAGVPVSYVPKAVLQRRVGRNAGAQGIAAIVSPVAYADVDEVVRAAQARPDGLILLLDRVTDGGNLGAVLRSAAAAGVDGVILAADGTAGLSAAAAKTAAGAMEKVRVAREAKLPRLIRRLNESGFETVVLDPRAEVGWDRGAYRGPVALVGGGEERGVRPGVLKECSGKVAIPLAAGVESLNVAVAVGVMLFEVIRQRRESPDALERKGARC